MHILKRVREKTISKSLIKKYKLEEVAFLDIEATGFNKEKDKIFSISIGTYGVNGYTAYVIFGDEDEEGDILKELFRLLEDRTTWCSFNGIAFDEPFLLRRAELNFLKKPKIEKHIDFYRRIRPYERALQLEGCSLKDLEKHLGIIRTDTIKGKDCREIFLKYMCTREEELKNKIILHNLEDVLYLPDIFLILEEINEKKLVRDDILTNSQKGYIKYLIKKRELKIKKIEFSNISKKDASRIIYYLIQREVDEDKINDIIKKNE
ncbi:hypothetical protein CPJCM30710_29820 [Clostridium polyendosporum]|uniref:YprB ribonuclease H-like domain-containing protein n=1 Tax=Clostridium polyendosporum TaxID=69208 RepID=A0A919VI17_9CLOT|nr:ribonuclease H-like domain-containing protein [Clostridium polyendosporum]GIM30316.1 hypothetical protein CPJCM30710_29820 [Clostridium polyendosporum]